MKLIAGVAHIICVAGLMTSITSSAGMVGTLSWDESSAYITDSTTNTIYTHLGLHKSQNYQEMQSLLTNNSEWAGFRIANQADAYSFVNSLVSSTGTALIDNTISRKSEEWIVNLPSNYNDGVLGNNFDGNRDFFFFESDFQNRLGLVALDADRKTVMLREANNTILDSNNYAKTGTSRESSWVTYLLVKSDSNTPESVTPVPEANTLALVFFGLLGMVGLQSRRRAT